jgi:hypothetical protein
MPKEVGMGLASEVAVAISDGVNGLCALLEWIDAGAVAPPPIDGAALREALATLEEVMRKILHGEQPPGEEAPFTEEDRACVLRLEELITEWASTGALSPEVATLGDQCVRRLWGGKGWRELLVGARP